MTIMGTEDEVLIEACCKAFSEWMVLVLIASILPLSTITNNYVIYLYH